MKSLNAPNSYSTKIPIWPLNLVSGHRSEATRTRQHEKLPSEDEPYSDRTALEQNEGFRQTGIYLSPRSSQSLLSESDECLFNYINLPPGDEVGRERWKLAKDLFLLNSQSHEAFPKETDFVVARAHNWPSVNWVSHESAWSSLGLSLASAVYDALHILAWDAAFKSPAQRLLWRISAVYVSTFWFLPTFVLFFVSVFISLLIKREPEENELPTAPEGSRESPLVAVLIYGVLIVSAFPVLLFLLAGGCLVVERFIALFHAPAGVFEVPQWSVYFPHIG